MTNEELFGTHKTDQTTAQLVTLIQPIATITAAYHKMLLDGGLLPSMARPLTTKMHESLMDILLLRTIKG